MKKRCICCFCIMLTFLSVSAVSADAQEWPPWDYGGTGVIPPVTHPGHVIDDGLLPPAQAVKWALRAFAATVSRVDGDRCAMMPSCSAYAIQAVDKHGLTLGLIMTYDRLMRCGGDEYRYAPLIPGHDGYSRLYDPLSHNDYWWYQTPDNLDK